MSHVIPSSSSGRRDILPVERQQVAPAPQAAAAGRQVLVLEPYVDTQAPESESPTLIDYLQLAQGHKVLLALMALLGLAAAALYTYFQVPRYMTRTTLQVHGIREEAQYLGSDDRAPGPESYLRTQVTVLQSRNMRERTATRMREKFPGRKYKSYLLTDRAKALLSRDFKEPVVDKFPLIITESKVLTDTRVIEISAVSTDPQFAADWLNTMVQAYMDSNLENALTGKERVTDYLLRQVDEARRKLQSSEAQLQASAGAIGTAPGDQPDRGDSIAAEKLRQLQSELSRAEADRVVKQSFFELVKTNAGDSALPQVVDNDRLSSLQSKLSELRREYAELTSQFTPAHYKVARIKAQIDELEGAVRNEREQIVNRIRNEYAAAVRRESLLSEAYRKQLTLANEAASKSVNYALLKQEVETNRTIYQQLLQRARGLDITSALQVSNVSVLDPAFAPDVPFSPNLAQNLLLGIFSGLLLGVGVVVGREFVNRSFQVPGDLSFYLKLPELGVIPESTTIVGEEKGLTPSLVPSVPNEKNGASNGQPHSVELVTWRDRPSVMAESFRSAITSLLVAKDTDGLQTLVLTSSQHGEGKSTMVSNLGIALAEIGQRVLLIDGDIRKPRLHTIFGMSNAWGLSNVLQEKTMIEDYPLEGLVRQTDVSGLWLLPSGPGTVSVASLLHSNRMRDLVNCLRKQFDMILIDTPPMSYLADARLLGRMADGAVIIVRAGLTSREAVMAVKQRLATDGIRLVGTILNGWDVRDRGRYGYSWYGYENRE